jgi:Cu/Ag efflux protein CusF
MVTFWSLTGCATYRLEPLGSEHPANPEAAGAPRAAISRTLAYERGNMPSPQPVSTAAAAERDGHDGHNPPAKAEANKKVSGEGKVVAVVPGSSQLVIEHGEIKGFMDAMTMGYRVDPPSLLEGLKSGDQVRFTIDVPKKTIVKIEKK